MTRAGVAKVLFDAPTIGARVGQLAAEVAGDYVGEAVLLVGVLKGSTPFLADLVRKLGLDASVDFMAISSYGAGGPRSGIVRILKDLDSDIGGRHVLIVEDIVDTGLTLTYLRRTLAARRPASLRTITLLDKAARRIVPVPVDYRGFEIADVFVVGYGLDWQGRYRNLRDLLAVDDVARLDPSALDERLGDAYGSRGVRFAP